MRKPILAKDIYKIYNLLSFAARLEVISNREVEKICTFLWVRERKR